MQDSNRSEKRADLVGGVSKPARPEGEGNGCARRGAFPVHELARAGRRVCDHAEGPLQCARVKRHHLHHVLIHASDFILGFTLRRCVRSTDGLHIRMP